ncbi:hypothetical protein ACFP65_07945 [Marinilactibacillus sp. GCM10026970]|uniref:hypothetical protein n=1 Tax=Marinilactibacillus sp. GCM10026970 TaxID=3252642 RepID=UPI003613EB16
MGLILSEDFDLQNLSLKDLEGFKKVLKHIDTENYVSNKEIYNDNEYVINFENQEYTENKSIDKKKILKYSWIEIESTQYSEENAGTPLAA